MIITGIIMTVGDGDGYASAIVVEAGQVTGSKLN